MTRPVLLLHLGAGALPEIVPVEPAFGSWAPAVYTPPVIPGPELVIVAGVVTVNCDFSDFHLLLTADVDRFEFINVGDAGTDSDVVTIDVEQTGTFTVAPGPNCTPISGVPYEATQAVGAVDVLGFKTFDAGTTWRYTVQQPAGGASALAVALSPSPASDSDAYDGVTPSAPSVQVTATATGGTAPLTYAWARVGSGGSNFLIDDATASDPVFSIAAGTTAYNATQQWRVTVTDSLGVTVQATVNVTLTRTVASLPAGGGWDGAFASALSVRYSGTATAKVWLEFKPTGAWELWKQESPNAAVLVDSGTWGAGVVGAEYEVKFTPDTVDSGIVNGAASYAALSVARRITASVSTSGGIESRAYDLTADLRRIDTPGTVTTGTVNATVEAERD